MMKALELKIPPVAVFIVVALLMHLAHTFAAGAHIAVPFSLAILFVSIAISGVVGISGIVAFRQAKTTVNPVKPEEASSVVDSGIYRYTRNPMYLGLLVLLIGLSIYYQNLLSVALNIVFVMYMNRFQIEPEEAVLEKKFGEEYLDYKQSVRRWI